MARQNGGFSYNGPNRRTEGQPTRRSTQRVAFTLPHRAQCGCSGIRLDSQRSGMEHGAGGGRARFPAIFDAAFRFAERAPRPSVRPPARLVPDRSFQKGRRTAPPLTRSLGLRRRRARPLLCLARPPLPSIATRPPTFLPSFSPKRYPPLPPTSLPVEARKPQVCSMQYHRARRLSHLSLRFSLVHHRLRPSVPFI